MALASLSAEASHGAGQHFDNYAVVSRQYFRMCNKNMAAVRKFSLTFDLIVITTEPVDRL
jgi:hypothetical protein